jgi:hypothetical protein
MSSLPVLASHPANSSMPTSLDSVECHALVLRADRVFPAEAGDEVAARVADCRDAEFAHQFEHVVAEAVRVGRRVRGLVDAVVDASAEMLDE